MSIRTAKRDLIRFVNDKQTPKVIANQIREIVKEINGDKWPDHMPLTAIHTVGDVRKVSNWHMDREIMSHIVGGFIGRSVRFILLEHNVDPMTPEALELVLLSNDLDQKILNQLIVN